MKWQQAYKLPVKIWGGAADVKVFTAEGSMAWDFMFGMFKDMFDGKEIMVISPEQKQDIVDLVNETKKGKIEGEVVYNVEQGTIEVDGKVLLLVRGWGHLTGGGGLNLKPEQAKVIQDDFANYIVQKLSGK